MKGNSYDVCLTVSECSAYGYSLSYDVRSPEKKFCSIDCPYKKVLINDIMHCYTTEECRNASPDLYVDEVTGGEWCFDADQCKLRGYLLQTTDKKACIPGWQCNTYNQIADPIDMICRDAENCNSMLLPTSHYCICKDS